MTDADDSDDEWVDFHTCPDGFCLSCWACRHECEEPGGPYPRDDDIASPEEWEKAGRTREAMKLTIAIDPGDAPPDVVADVLIALDALHRAYGGDGLVFRVDPSVPPDEVHFVQNGRTVGKIINVKG